MLNKTTIHQLNSAIITSIFVSLCPFSGIHQTPEDWRSNGATIITSVIGCQQAQQQQQQTQTQPHHQTSNEIKQPFCHNNTRPSNTKCPACTVELLSSDQILVKTEMNLTKPNVDQQTQSNYYTIDNNGNRDKTETEFANLAIITAQQTINSEKTNGEQSEQELIMKTLNRVSMLDGKLTDTEFATGGDMEYCHQDKNDNVHGENIRYIPIDTTTRNRSNRKLDKDSLLQSSIKMLVNNDTGDHTNVTDQVDVKSFETKSNSHTKINDNDAFNSHEMDRNAGANIRCQYIHNNNNNVDHTILANDERSESDDQINSMLNDNNQNESADSFVYNDKKHYRPTSSIIVNNSDCNCDYDNVDDVNVDRNGLINRQPSSTITELISAIDNNDNANDNINVNEHYWNTRDSFNNNNYKNRKRNKHQKWSSIDNVKPLDPAASLIMDQQTERANIVESNGPARIFIRKNWFNENIIKMNVNDDDNDDDLGLINNNINNCCDENGDVVHGIQAIDDYIDRDCYDYGFYALGEHLKSADNFEHLSQPNLMLINNNKNANNNNNNINNDKNNENRNNDYFNGIKHRNDDVFEESICPGRHCLASLAPLANEEESDKFDLVVKHFNNNGHHNDHNNHNTGDNNYNDTNNRFSTNNLIDNLNHFHFDTNDNQENRYPDQNKPSKTKTKSKTKTITLINNEIDVDLSIMNRSKKLLLSKLLMNNNDHNTVDNEDLMKINANNIIINKKSQEKIIGRYLINKNGDKNQINNNNNLEQEHQQSSKHKHRIRSIENYDNNRNHIWNFDLINLNNNNNNGKEKQLKPEQEPEPEPHLHRHIIDDYRHYYYDRTRKLCPSMPAPISINRFDNDNIHRQQQHQQQRQQQQTIIKSSVTRIRNRLNYSLMNQQQKQQYQASLSTLKYNHWNNNNDQSKPNNKNIINNKRTTKLINYSNQVAEMDDDCHNNNNIVDENPDSNIDDVIFVDPNRVNTEQRKRFIEQTDIVVNGKNNVKHFLNKKTGNFDDTNLNNADTDPDPDSDDNGKTLAILMQKSRPITIPKPATKSTKQLFGFFGVYHQDVDDGLNGQGNGNSLTMSIDSGTNEDDMLSMNSNNKRTSAIGLPIIDSINDSTNTAQLAPNAIAGRISSHGTGAHFILSSNSVEEFNQEIAELMEKNQMDCKENNNDELFAMSATMTNGGRRAPVCELLIDPPILSSSYLADVALLDSNSPNGSLIMANDIKHNDNRNNNNNNNSHNQNNNNHNNNNVDNNKFQSNNQNQNQNNQNGNGNDYWQDWSNMDQSNTCMPFLCDDLDEIPVLMAANSDDLLKQEQQQRQPMSGTNGLMQRRRQASFWPQNRFQANNKRVLDETDIDQWLKQEQHSNNADLISNLATEVELNVDHAFSQQHPGTISKCAKLNGNSSSSNNNNNNSNNNDKSNGWMETMLPSPKMITSDKGFEFKEHSVLLKNKPKLYQPNKMVDQSEWKMANNLFKEFIHHCHHNQHSCCFNSEQDAANPASEFILKPSYQSAFLPISELATKRWMQTSN